MSDSKFEVPKEDPKYDPSLPFPGIKVLYKHPISNCPGMSILATEVDLPPNAATPPHSHAGAFVSAYILSGNVLNGMNKDPLQALSPGDKFFENPGCKHRVCNNLSKTEGASILSILILETEVLDRIGVEGTVVIDEDYREMVMEALAKKQNTETAAGGK